MANKVVKIGTSDSSSSDEKNDNVYVDISMISSLKMTRKVEESGETTLTTGYRIEKSVDVNAVRNSLDNIFSWIQGERILNPEFGSNLHSYLYEGITEYNEEQIVAEIKNSVQRWEPRIVITQVINKTNNDDRDDNTIVLDIKYYIKGLPDTVYDKQYVFNRNM